MKHEKWKHSNVENKISFECKKCDKVLATEGILKNHVKRFHDKMDNYKCDICGKTFVTNNCLLRHQRNSHASKKLFNCRLCDQEFKTNERLDQHYESNHDIEKSYFKLPKVEKCPIHQRS